MRGLSHCWRFIPVFLVDCTGWPPLPYTPPPSPTPKFTSTSLAMHRCQDSLMSWQASSTETSCSKLTCLISPGHPFPTTHKLLSSHPTNPRSGHLAFRAKGAKHTLRGTLCVRAVTLSQRWQWHLPRETTLHALACWARGRDQWQGANCWTKQVMAHFTLTPSFGRV